VFSFVGLSDINFVVVEIIVERRKIGDIGDGCEIGKVFIIIARNTADMTGESEGTESVEGIGGEDAEGTFAEDAVGDFVEGCNTIGGFDSAGDGGVKGAAIKGTSSHCLILLRGGFRGAGFVDAPMV
jgi:hypothetical protein